MLNHLHKPLKTLPFVPKPLGIPETSVEERTAVCAECGFNLDWKCEHSGCAVCPGKAAKLGPLPLKILLTKPYFKCPMRKF